MAEANITVQVDGKPVTKIAVELGGFGSANRRELSKSLGEKIVDSIWSEIDKGASE